MFSGRRLFVVGSLFASLACATLFVPAQQPQTGAQPRQRPTPPAEKASEPEAQDEIKVRTEEVRVPVFATDEQGRFDPSLEVQDILILEDDVPQEVRSVRRIPASILILVGTGAELNPAIRTSTSRAAARYLVSTLREGDALAALQFSHRVEVLQDWTEEKSAVDDALKKKLAGGRGAHLAQAILEAARMFRQQPVGNRHLVLITDGVEMPGGRLGYKEALKVLNASGEASTEARRQMTEAVKQLNAAGATVHIISYTSIGQSELKLASKRERPVVGMTQRSETDMSTAGIDPTRPPGMGGPGFNAPRAGLSVNFDPQMRKLRQAYERAMQRSEERLTTLAEETGGRLWLPATSDELISSGRDVAREIGSQYVVTYSPKRPLSDAPASEYRRIVVAPRRLGLKLRARRGYVVAATR